MEPFQPLPSPLVMMPQQEGQVATRHLHPAHVLGVTPFGLYCRACSSPDGGAIKIGSSRRSINTHLQAYHPSIVMASEETVKLFSQAVEDLLKSNLEDYLVGTSTKGHVCMDCGYCTPKRNGFQRHFSGTKNECNPEKILTDVSLHDTICGRLVSLEYYQTKIQQPAVEVNVAKSVDGEADPKDFEKVEAALLPFMSPNETVYSYTTPFFNTLVDSQDPRNTLREMVLRYQEPPTSRCTN